MRKMVLVLWLILLLTACSAQEPEPALPVSSSTPLPAPSETAAIQPTETATLAPTITSTSVPSEASAFILADQSFQLQAPQYHLIENSPNGEWAVWAGELAELENYPHLIVENLSGGQSWLVTFSHEYQHAFCYDQCFLEPVAWSADGNYLYYKAVVSGDGMVFSTSTAVGLFKVFLFNGQANTILPPGHNSYYLAVSPDGARLVYVLKNNPWITFSLEDLETHTGDSFTIQIEDQTFGNIQWSPDGQYFVFNTYSEDWSMTVTLVNTQDYSFVNLFQGEFLLDYFEWNSPVEVLLVSDEITDQPNLLINIQTGEITPVEPTDD